NSLHERTQEYAGEIGKEAMSLVLREDIRRRREEAKKVGKKRQEQEKEKIKKRKKRINILWLFRGQWRLH
ncbi:TPA: hypothetical protein DCW38_04255, partial [candidate division WOR-3 bacterium]|nr:hypothetical protein [candidate division WOR-3 bacterium]